MTAEFVVGDGRASARTCSGSRSPSRSRSCTRAVLLVALLGYAVNVGLRAAERRVVFWGGEERVAGREDSLGRARGGRCSAGRLRRARSRVWEVWARGEASFLVPPASAVARAGVGRLADARVPRGTSQASLRRLAAGFAIGAASASPSGSSMGARVRVRRALEPLVELAARDAADRGRPRRDRGPRLRRRDARSRDRLRRVLPGPRQHGRGRSRRLARGARHGVDAARRARPSGSSASTCPPRSRRSSPGSASRSRSGSCSSSSPSSSAGGRRPRATTSSIQQRSSTCPRCTAASSSSACSATS